MLRIDSLPEKERKTYWLIERYRHKCSARLLIKQKDLEDLSRVTFSESWERAAEDAKKLSGILFPKLELDYGLSFVVPVVLGKDPRKKFTGIL